MVVSTVSRSFRYIRGIRIEKNIIHIEKPRANIAITKSLLRSVVSGVEIYAYLVALRVARIFKASPANRSIAFFPQQAAPWYNIWIAVQLSSLKITSDVKNSDFVFAFDDETYSDLNLPPLRDRQIQINQHANNISKQLVADKFSKTFGYDLSIDPTTYQGKAVRKSQENGTHDGEVVDCPIDPSDVVSGFAYQRLVDTTIDENTTDELRVPFVFGDFPVVYRKFKAIEKRFGTDYQHVDLLDADGVFSEEEKANIVKFCKEMGLDFGCLDVMRDKNNGQIYIVDVNKTCMPVLSLSIGKQIEAQRKIAVSLETALTNCT